MILSLFFERALLLAAILAVGVVILLFRWANRRDRASVRAVLIGLGLLVFAPSVSLLVVTDREEIMTACDQLARAVDAGDLGAIHDALAPELTAASLDRAAFLERVERALTRFRVDQPRLWGFEIELGPSGRAVAEFSASAQIRAAEGVWDRLPTMWKLALRREGQRWRVTRIESLPVPPLNLRTTDDWLR